MVHAQTRRPGFPHFHEIARHSAHHIPFYLGRGAGVWVVVLQEQTKTKGKQVLGLSEYITEIGVGGIFCAVILHIVLTHLEKIKGRKGDGMTQYIAKPSPDCTKLANQLTEVHDALLAPPPRDSLVATIRELKEATEEQAQKQKETVSVLEQIRELLKSHSDKLDAAKCGGCAVTAEQKKM